MTKKYDSAEDTQQHHDRVVALVKDITDELRAQACDHDASKLGPDEKPIFDEFTPKLKGSTFGSEEYKKFLADMKPALDHHYEANRHHPEHFDNGINGMTLVDIIEMLADWKAASERHENGNIMTSIDLNAKRFKISDQLKEILVNTVKTMGWDRREKKL